MAKKIVICCDGTGNEIKENQSNVLKFYRVLKDSSDQIRFYDPGVGTAPDTNAWSAARNKLRTVFGQATGHGLDTNVIEAYRFLMRHYRVSEPDGGGDQIYLLGFSRGAYTVRVLAGLIQMLGLLHPNQEHLIPYALEGYRQASRTNSFDVAWRVQEVLNTKRITIRFIGCWDTVSSVIVPWSDQVTAPTIESLPYTQSNPSVQVFRQACAIDERRRMFRLSRWSEPQLYKSNPFQKDEQAAAQDIKQVWFAGVHSDVGGGYPEQESGASKYPLGWMVDEARKHGLEFRERMVKRLVEGENPANVAPGSKRDYSAPSPIAKLHDSLTLGWRPIEFLPKRKKRHDNPSEKNRGWIYIPMGERRYIPKGSLIHPSVLDRHRHDPDYDPPNLPDGWKETLEARLTDEDSQPQGEEETEAGIEPTSETDDQI